jgi:hypothetical protein
MKRRSFAALKQLEAGPRKTWRALDKLPRLTLERDINVTYKFK